MHFPSQKALRSNSNSWPASQSAHFLLSLGILNFTMVLKMQPFNLPDKKLLRMTGVRTFCHYPSMNLFHPRHQLASRGVTKAHADKQIAHCYGQSSTSPSTGKKKRLRWHGESSSGAISKARAINACVEGNAGKIRAIRSSETVATNRPSAL
jgi:hypothetical protein